MGTNLTLPEIQAKKKELKKQIDSLISAFVQETGIYGVEVQSHVETMETYDGTDAIVSVKTIIAVNL
jgi:hypothetical protein